MVTLNTPFFSKINWTQGVALTAALFTFFNSELPPEQQAALLAGIQGVQSIATWIMRTWFTGRPV